MSEISNCKFVIGADNCIVMMIGEVTWPEGYAALGAGSKTTARSWAEPKAFESQPVQSSSGEIAVEPAGWLEAENPPAVPMPFETVMVAWTPLDNVNVCG